MGGTFDCMVIIIDRCCHKSLNEYLSRAWAYLWNIHRIFIFAYAMMNIPWLYEDEVFNN